MRRWLLPIAAAAAVLLLLGGLWYFAGPGSRGNDTPFASGDTGSGSDPGSGGVVPGSPGGTGGDPGPAPDQPVPATPTDPMAVRVDSYYAYDERHLALSYTIGIPECYGEIATPQIEESPHSVTVTLTRVPPKRVGDVACIEIALLKTVDIELVDPLGDRVVRDGSLQGAPVPPGSPPGPEAATR